MFDVNDSATSYAFSKLTDVDLVTHESRRIGACTAPRRANAILVDEIGIDISDRTPRQITPEDIENADYVVAMGCSVEQFRPDDWDGGSFVWELESVDTREQRDELSRRVEQFFDDIERHERAVHGAEVLGGL